MLVSGFTIQVWLDWDKTPRDVYFAMVGLPDGTIHERKEGDIIMFSPRVTELSPNFEQLVKVFDADIIIPHPTRMGTIFVKRANGIQVRERTEEGPTSV